MSEVEARPTGRPRKLTPELQERYLSYVRTGVSNKVAALAAGISPTTVMEWIARGEGRHPARDGDEVFAGFAEAVARVRSEREAYLAGLIAAAAPEDWKAAAWLLERGMPDTYGRSNRVELSGPQGTPIEVARADVVEQPIDMEAVEAMRQVMERTFPTIDTTGEEIAVVVDETPELDPPSNGNGHKPTTNGNGMHA